MSSESAMSPETSTPGRFFRAPVVAVFFVVSLLLWLIRADEANLQHLLMQLHDPTIEGFFASHLFHQSGLQLVVNLLVVVLTGAILETRWGSARFAVFYLACAWGGSALTLGMAQLLGEDGFSCGASSVAIGCLVSIGMLYPDVSLWRWVPPNRQLVWIGVFIGGSLLALLQHVERAAAPPGPTYIWQVAAGVPCALAFLTLLPLHERWLERRKERRAEEARRRVREIRERVDQLLDKISQEGYSSLSRDELNFLRSASKHFSDDD